MSLKKIISWDLGATKLAAALVVYNSITEQYQIETTATELLRESGDLFELNDKLETKLNINFAECDAVVIGAAGQFNGMSLELQHGYPYAMPLTNLFKQKHWQNVAVVHDYTPIVCSIFIDSNINSEQLKWIHQGRRKINGRHIALGVGTGLGLKDAVLLEDGKIWLGTNEIGHIGISIPACISAEMHQLHNSLIEYLKYQSEDKTDLMVTFEHVLSGAGLRRLHQFITTDYYSQLTPADIGALIHSGEAEKTAAIFAFYLGLLLAMIQLTFMPDGGIYISGGVLTKHLGLFDYPEFQQGLTAFSAYQQQRSEFPIAVLIGQEHAFLGAAFYAVKQMLR